MPPAHAQLASSRLRRLQLADDADLHVIDSVSFERSTAPATVRGTAMPKPLYADPSASSVFAA
jgi:hypothetical protein